MQRNNDPEGQPKLEIVQTILVGDPPLRNPVQKWLRDVIGLSQDAESGNLVARLMASNTAAIAKNIRLAFQKLQDIVAIQNSSTEAINALERRLSFYETNCETIAYQKRKLDRMAAVEAELAKEPRLDVMCPVCNNPISSTDMIALMPSKLGELEVHASCFQSLSHGVLVAGTPVTVEEEARNTSRSLTHMHMVEDSDDGN